MGRHAHSHMVPMSYNFLVSPKTVQAVTAMTPPAYVRRRRPWEVFRQLTWLPCARSCLHLRGGVGQMLMMTKMMSGSQCGLLLLSQRCTNSRLLLTCLQAAFPLLPRHLPKQSAASLQRQQSKQSALHSPTLSLRACCVRPKRHTCMRSEQIRRSSGWMWCECSTDGAC